jgi:hypothetical protein
MVTCNLPSDRFVKTIEEISERMNTLTNLFIYADTPARLAEIAQQLESRGFRLRLSADFRSLRSMNYGAAFPESVLRLYLSEQERRMYIQEGQTQRSRWVAFRFGEL